MIKATFIGKFNAIQLKKCMGIISDMEANKVASKEMKDDLSESYGILDFDLMFKIKFKHLTNEFSHVIFRSINLDKMKNSHVEDISEEDL